MSAPESTVQALDTSNHLAREVEKLRGDYERICLAVGMVDYAEGYGKKLPTVDELCQEIRDTTEKIRDIEEYHFMANLAESWCEEDGEVLWWRFPVQEAPYVGSPMCEDWHDDYYTHWTKLPIPWELPPAEAKP